MACSSGSCARLGWLPFAGVALAVGLLVLFQGLRTAYDEQPTSPQSELLVAAASDLRHVFEELVTAFQKIHPEVRIQTSFGSSGSLLAQIENQAPFDLFLSADRGYPRRAIEKELTLSDKEFIYALGRLVVWIPNDSTIQLESEGLKALLDPALGKIALANPKYAPYGQLADRALDAGGVRAALQPRFLLGENVAQAAQFVQSGAASAGLISLSLANSPTLQKQGRAWLVPTALAPPLEQGGVILRQTKNPRAAVALRDFLLGPDGRVILARHGFGLPEK